jgi:hypothetical protein
VTQWNVVGRYRPFNVRLTPMFLQEKQEQNKCPCNAPRFKDPYIQYCMRRINEGSSEARRCETNHKFVRSIYMCICSPVVGYQKQSYSTSVHVSIWLKQYETGTKWCHPKCFVLIAKENKCRDNSEKDTNDNSADKSDTYECLLIWCSFRWQRI